MEPISQCLWILGGEENEGGTWKAMTDILEISHMVSLKDLAIHCAARNISLNDPRLAPGKYPKKLRAEIKAHKSQILKKRSRKRKLGS